MRFAGDFPLIGGMSRLREIVRRWWPAAVWMGLIFVGSTDLLADQRTAGLLRPILHTLLPFLNEPELERLHFMLRKLGHVTEYAVLATLLWRGWQARPAPPKRFGRSQAALVILMLCATYAASDEWHQSFTASRHADGVDVLIDSCGALLGIGWGAWRSRRTTRTSRPVRLPSTPP